MKFEWKNIDRLLSWSIKQTNEDIIRKREEPKEKKNVLMNINDENRRGEEEKTGELCLVFCSITTHSLTSVLVIFNIIIKKSQRERKRRNHNR